MKNISPRIAGWINFLLFLSITFIAVPQDPRERHYMYPVLEPDHEPKRKVDGWATTRVKEHLNRGILAGVTGNGDIYLSWRFLDTDNKNTCFSVYRSINGGEEIKLTTLPNLITNDYTDNQALKKGVYTYRIVPVLNDKELNEGEKVKIEYNKNSKESFISIPLQGDYRPSKLAVADLNGDGAYDFIIKQPRYGIDPGHGPDRYGVTYKIEAYLGDGTFLWRNDLGPGIEPGIWYSPFIAYDFDGDGKAEIAVKTNPEGNRDSIFRVRNGIEYISIWDGMTGEDKARAPWPPPSPRYGDLNRNSRNQMAMAYLDGKTPCVLAQRGTYRLMVLDAYQYHNEELEQLWHWDGDEENPVIRQQGSHGIHTADVDEDGREEVILGSVVVDDNGTALWSTGYGHPDKCFVSDIDPFKPGLEIFYALEVWHDSNGVCLVDANTGKTIWNIGHKTLHVGDGMVADIDPSYPGLECFASEDPKGGSSDKYLLSARGDYISRNNNVPDCQNWMFWDGDLLRETITRPGRNSYRELEIFKPGGEILTKGLEGGIIMIADILGDWREEVITVLEGEIRIYYTTIPAKDRRVCLMQDPVYRAEVAHRSMGYDQSPVTSYYLGE